MWLINLIEFVAPLNSSTNTLFTEQFVLHFHFFLFSNHNNAFRARRILFIIILSLLLFIFPLGGRQNHKKKKKLWNWKKMDKMKIEIQSIWEQRWTGWKVHSRMECWVAFVSLLSSFKRQNSKLKLSNRSKSDK